MKILRNLYKIFSSDTFAFLISFFSIFSFFDYDFSMPWFIKNFFSCLIYLNACPFFLTHSENCCHMSLVSLFELLTITLFMIVLLTQIILVLILRIEELRHLLGIAQIISSSITKVSERGTSFAFAITLIFKKLFDCSRRL